MAGGHQHRGRRTAPRIPRSAVPAGEVVEVEILADHNEEVRATEDHFKAAKTVKDHNRRIMQQIRWVQAHYPEYAEQVVVELTDEQKADTGRYHKSTHDFLYQNLNVLVAKSFLAAHKFKPGKFTQDGTPIHYSYSHLRKFHDAIIHGATRQGVPLPEVYEIEMRNYLDSMLKEKTKAKKAGQTEEREADAISFELYRLLCKLAIKTSNMFLWAFTVMQWNCMARSVNIDDMTFAQISLGTDSLVVEYCDSKADQKGERTSPKNCYSNPFDFNVCIFTALGCFFCINEETWTTQKDTLFRSRNSKQGSAAHKYCNQIQKLYRDNQQMVEEYVRAGHFNPHGTRKGAAVCASSGTTLPASLAAIANRGEWSIGMMFEIYLGFAEPGDQYLGRLLAGLLPNSEEFAAIPPHFSAGMENEHIREAMHLCFNGIMAEREGVIREEGQTAQEHHEQVITSLRANTKSFLLRCLAAMVHHSDALKEVICANPGHCFGSIPLFTHPTLLTNLKPLVTTKPSDRIRMATGIPPHVEAMTKINELAELIREEREERRQHYEEIKQTVGDKIEEIAIQHGNITRPAVIQLFNDFSSRFENTISNKIDGVLESVLARTGHSASQNNENSTNNSFGSEESTITDSMNYTLWSYKGKFWHVPESFVLPNGVKRKRAWEFWLKGVTLEDGKRIRPFRFFKPSLLPKKIATKFKVEWQPILKKMSATPGLELSADSNAFDSAAIETTFAMATQHLKSSTCSFLWKKKNSIIENWSVASWSSNTQRSYIMKHGSESDKANLPSSTRYNNPHRRKRTVKRKRQSGSGGSHSSVRRRVENSTVTINSDSDDTETESDEPSTVENSTTDNVAAV